jgi:hypothetical protein
MTTKRQEPHPTYVRGDNRQMRFLEILKEVCPICLPASGGCPLGIVARTDNSETVHCTGCDYMITRGLRPEEEFLPMNSRVLNKPTIEQLTHPQTYLSSSTVSAKETPEE